MKSLLKSSVPLFGVEHCPWPWSSIKALPFCGTCCCWGHHTHACKSRCPWCASCGRPHLTTSHSAAATANLSLGCLLCLNCNKEHSALSCDCPFYKAWFSPSRLQLLEEGHISQLKASRKPGHPALQQLWANCPSIPPPPPHSPSVDLY